MTGWVESRAQHWAGWIGFADAHAIRVGVENPLRSLVQFLTRYSGGETTRVSVFCSLAILLMSE